MRASCVGGDGAARAAAALRLRHPAGGESRAGCRLDSPLQGESILQGMRAQVTIGDFSRASHLSVKTLRHYHEVGLLEPAEVDPDTGYRYYSEEQIPIAQVIRRRRGLQMPVADVKSVLTATDSEARNRLIVAHLDRLEADLARTRAAVGELRALLERPQPPRAVLHRTAPPTNAIAIRQTVDRDDVLAWWQGALGELHAIVRAEGLRPSGPSSGLYSGEIFQ